MTKLFDRKTSKLIDIPEDQVTAAIQTGNYVFKDGSNVPMIGPDGESVWIPSIHAYDAAFNGYSYEGPKAEKTRKLNEEYGDRPLEAAALGAARGLTFGFSDVLLDKSDMIGKEALSAIESNNQFSSLLGEAGGVILPSLFGGGSTAISKALGGLGIGVRSVEKAGEVAGTAAMKALTKDVTSNITKNLVKRGTQGAVEGAFYSFGNLASEAALGNEDFTAESIIHSVGFGGLIGGAFGLGVTTLASGAEKTLSIAKNSFYKKLRDAVENKDYKWFEVLGANKSTFRKLYEDARKKGPEVARKEIKEMSSFIRSNMNNHGEGFSAYWTRTDDLWKNITNKRDEAIHGMDKAISGADDQYKALMDDYIEVKRLVDADPEQLTGLKSFEMPTELKSNAITNYDLYEIYREKYFEKNIGEMTSKSDLNKMSSFLDELLNFRSSINTDGFAEETFYSLKDIRDLRKIIDKRANYESRKPGEFLKTMRSFRNDVEEELINRVSKMDGGEEIAREYNSFKKQYQLSEKALKVIDLKMAAESANNGIPLTGYISGGVGASIAGLPGALAAIATRQAAREFGDQAQALILDKIASTHFGYEQTINKVVDGFFKKAGNATRTALIEQSVKKIDYNKELDDLSEKAGNVQGLANKFSESNGDIEMVAPLTYQQLTFKYFQGLKLLDDRIPKPPVSEFAKEIMQPSDAQLNTYMKYKEAVENPDSILKNISNGIVSPEETEVLRVVYPETFSKIQELMTNYIAENKVPYHARLKISSLFGVKTDNYLKAHNVMYLQSLFGNDMMQQSSNNEKGSVPKNINPKKIGVSRRQSGASDRIANRRSLD